MIDYRLDPEGSILYARLSGPLAAEDFARLASAVDPHIEATGGLSGVIVEASGFPGWESFGAMVNHLRATGRRGRIINISSVHEEIPFPNFAAYCASKGGLKMLTRNLAVELGPLGITVNSVAPGAIATPINTALLNDSVKLRSLTGQIPLARLGTTDDVAGVAVFLASDEAAYVTGSTYVVDGGLTWFYQEQ